MKRSTKTKEKETRREEKSKGMQIEKVTLLSEGLPKAIAEAL